MCASISTKGPISTLSVSEQRINMTKSLAMWSDAISTQMRLFGDFSASSFFGFPIHESYLTIMTLMVHLENGQHIYFTTEAASQIAEQPKDSTLTAFFNLCQNEPFAQTLLTDIPASSYFTALAESTQSTLANRNASTSSYYCTKYKDIHHLPISKLSMDIPRQHTMRLAGTMGYWRATPNGILQWPKLLPCIPQEDFVISSLFYFNHATYPTLQNSSKNSRKISQKNTGTKANCYFQTSTFV